MVASVQQSAGLEKKFPVWQRKTLGAHFAERCQEYASRPLLLTSSATYSYEEVWRESVNAAKAMLSLGIKRRDHVALIVDNKPEYVALKIGIFLIGAVCIPINTMLRDEELDYMFRQSDTQWLFIHDKIKNNPLRQTVQHIMEQHDEGNQSTNLEIQKVVCIPNGPSKVKQRDVGSFMEWDDFLAPASLARFKIPRHVWFVDEEDWPLSGTGKVQKFRLRERAEEYLNKNGSFVNGEGGS